MTTKFCTTCQVTRPIEGGEIRKNKVTRWVCGACVTKKSISPYQSQAGLQRAANGANND